jgi:hypothetical protein
MLKAFPLPQARLAGISWLDRLSTTAALLHLTHGLYREVFFYPEIRFCDSCAVPLEDAQPYFFTQRYPVECYCLECTYHMVRDKFEFPEPPSTLVVDASGYLGET